MRTYNKNKVYFRGGRYTLTMAELFWQYMKWTSKPKPHVKVTQTVSVSLFNVHFYSQNRVIDQVYFTWAVTHLDSLLTCGCM